MAHGTYKGKSLKPGGGGRFARLVDQLRARGMSEKRARAVAASVGRRKYGAKQKRVVYIGDKKVVIA
jgi:hypothetical protein